MQIDFAFLCDAATEGAGKVHAIGIGFERISVRSLPVVHPRAVAVVRFAFTRADVGEHPFTLRVLDGEGRHVVPQVEGNVKLTVSDDASGGRANMIVDLVQLDLQTYGPHEVTVTFDGREFVSLPFEVVAG